MGLARDTTGKTHGTLCVGLKGAGTWGFATRVGHSRIDCWFTLNMGRRGPGLVVALTRVSPWPGFQVDSARKEGLTRTEDGWEDSSIATSHPRRAVEAKLTCWNHSAQRVSLEAATSSTDPPLQWAVLDGHEDLGINGGRSGGNSHDHAVMAHHCR